MDYENANARKAAALTWVFTRKSQSPHLYRFTMEDATVTENGDVEFPSAKMDIENPYVVKDKDIFFILNYSIKYLL